MQASRRSLAGAQWIVTFMYVVPLVVFPFVPRFLRPELNIDATTLSILSGVLFAVALLDYGASLFIERVLLAKAQTAADPKQAGRASAGAHAVMSPVLTAALVVGGFGASLAVYGLVLTVLGSRTWGAALYVLCCVHGFHLLTRWPKYVHAAEGASRYSDNQDSLP